MTAYYNENDPFMVEWLRELIKENLIAPGEVDGRDIKEVDEKDLDGFTQCHFFAGIGVWSYALRKAGWPDDLSVWTGSCPCPSFSASGKRRGFSDPRHLWPTWGRLVRERRPLVVFGEQVAKKDGYAWLDVVSSELEAEGYTVGAADIPACGFGAPHLRNRIYFVAHTNGLVLRELAPAGNQSLHRHSDETRGVVDAERRRCEQRNAQLGRVQVSHAGGTDTGPMGDTSSRGRRVRGAKEIAEGQRYLDGADSPDRMDVASGARLQGHAGDVSNREEKQEEARPTPATGPLNGFWAEDALWLACSDGKMRPTRSGIFPLASRTPNRVGALRGAGNSLVAPTAQGFIESFLEVMA